MSIKVNKWHTVFILVFLSFLWVFVLADCFDDPFIELQEPDRTWTSVYGLGENSRLIYGTVKGDSDLRWDLNDPNNQDNLESRLDELEHRVELLEFYVLP